MKPVIFMDQLDADKCAADFIEETINKIKSNDPRLSIEYHNLSKNNQEVDGRVTTLWFGERIIAITNVIRTPMNWSQVICQKIEQ